MRYLAEYLAARLLAMGLTMGPADAAVDVAAGLGRGLCAVDARHRRRACDHLTRSFPEWTAARTDDVVRRSFAHLLQLAAEVIYVPRVLHADSWARRVRLTRMGPAIEVLNAGRGALLITGHLGNWEVLGFLLAVLGYPMHAIARPLDNPYINRWLLDIRQRRGMSVITKWDATQRMLEVLRQGGLLGFIADQNAGDRGLFVPFFGRLASTYKSIGLLAITQERPIVCGYARRIGPGCRYEMGVEDIIHPEDWRGRDDPLFYVTARYMRAIELMVRAAPEQYLWMHRRWKSRPRWEKQGKPMPDAVRRSLQSLPWMTETEMARLQAPAEAPV